jgi:hypothetical protein
MNRTIALSAVAVALLGAAAQPAHGQQQPPPAMTFFIAQNPTGTGNSVGSRAPIKFVKTPPRPRVGSISITRGTPTLARSSVPPSRVSMRVIASALDPGTTPRVN